jgi:hypothetical protein
LWILTEEGEERRGEERREEDPLSTWFFAGRLQQEAAQEAPSCTVDASIVACVVTIDMRVGALIYTNSQGCWKARVIEKASVAFHRMDAANGCIRSLSAGGFFLS